MFIFEDFDERKYSAEKFFVLSTVTSNATSNPGLYITYLISGICFLFVFLIVFFKRKNGDKFH
jgi:hypothetical protein